MRVRSITAGNPGPFTLDGTRTWLLGDTVVIDPGPAIPSHISAVAEAQPRVEIILLTHRHEDHAPGAVELKRRTGARIFAPAGALEESKVDRILTDGDRIEAGDVSLTVVASPGHTSEHVCYLSAEGELFTGDVVLGEGTTTIFPPDGNMADYLATLRRLLTLAPRVIYPGHGPIRQDAIDWLQYYIDHRLEREAQILAALSDGEKTIRELRQVIYRQLHPALEPAAEIQLRAHADHLVVQEKVGWSADRLHLL